MVQPIRLAALFILSTGLIAFELDAMRVFSVGSWSNFGSLVISTALLGFGVAGAILTFAEKRLEHSGDRWLYGSSLLFMVAMPLAQVATRFIPFEPTFLGNDPAQLWWIALYYLVYGLPFVAGAAFIGVAFVVLRGQVSRLYFWNMAGSGAGGFFAILFMYFLAPDQLLLPVILLALAANLLVALRPAPDGRLRLPTRRLGLSLGAALLACALLMNLGQVRVSEYKSISYARKYPELNLKHHSVSPAGEYHVFQSSYFHFAPGLSDNASLAMDTFPSQPFWALYVDGSGPVGIMGRLDAKGARYVDFLPMAAPYEVKEAPRVLLVNLGGGINAQVARCKGASEVVILEQNPHLTGLLRDDPAVADFTGEFLRNDSRIHLEEAEARAWCRSNPGQYDIVEISLIDSIGLSDSGGYGIRENFTYTKEAIRDYLGGLKPDGMLSITVWNNLSPPRNVLRLLSTIVAALEEDSPGRAGRRIFMFDQLRSTATILVTRSDLDPVVVDSLKSFVARNSFNLVYHPGMAWDPGDLTAWIAACRARLGQAGQSGAAEFTPSQLYQLGLRELLEGRSEQLFARYPFDIRPMLDDRPYYSGYLKLDELGLYLGDINQISEEWGYLLQLGILVQALAFGLVVILLPMFGKWREVFARQRGKTGVIAYFACLGLNYMLVEVFLMQRLVAFLGNPVFSTSIVITVMLICSGIGNLVSHRLKASRTVRVRLAVLGIVAVLALYLVFLGPVLDLFQNHAMAVRILVTVGLVAPAAFFMGMPYPNGLAALGEKRPGLLPWAWGMNGGLSVAGTALAWVVSVSTGFTFLLLLVMALYALVGVLFPVNEIEEAA